MGLAAAVVVPAAAGGPGSPSWPAPPVPKIVVSSKHLGTVSPFLFGANLLWVSDAEGGFDPSTGAFYPAFVQQLRRLGLTILRYPGGTTSDSFHWLRAIGPLAHRGLIEPYGMQAARLSDVCCVLDGPQRALVGPDEFGHLLGQTGAVGTITVNFATGTAREAADFVAYMTAPQSPVPSSNPSQPSYWAALRARDGHPAPYDVPYWEVGNEQLFPGQYGWRSGELVRLGPHGHVPCPPGQVATCLYIFGGTTYFAHQMVGRPADQLPSASFSTGAPGQQFQLYFPPAVPGTVSVYVDGQRWAPVKDLASVGPGARVYALRPATGVITFGDGEHGRIPPAGAEVTASYQSGPHGGFIEFYRAMKRMNPHIQVCASEETDVAFLQVMGRKYPYDCVELHEYARPPDITAPLTRYEEGLMAFPGREAAYLAQLQSEIRKYSGRNVPVFMTEYGQLVAPMPVADPAFNLSLYEGLFEGAQLIEWMAHGVRVAEKYLAASAPFTMARLTVSPKVPYRRDGPALYQARLRQVLDLGKAMVYTGLSPDSGMVANWGGQFLAEPTGQVLSLLRELAGQARLAVSVSHAPRLPHSGGARALWAVAAANRQGQVTLVVLNVSPDRAFSARVVLRGRPGYRASHWVQAELLDGPSPTAYNTPVHPAAVRITSYAALVAGNQFDWRFPAHSVTLLRLAPSTSPAS